jgi:hypothetical protein
MHTGSNSLEAIAFYTAVKGFDFEVLEPAELVPMLRAIVGRLNSAAGASEPASTRPPSTRQTQ